MSGPDIEGALSAHSYEIGHRTGSICLCGFVPTLPLTGRLTTQQDHHRAHVAAVLREQIDGAIITATVGALRYAAELAGAHENDELAGQLHDAARNTEGQVPGDWWCCPVCEEATCDEGCPLEPIRAAHLSDTERAGDAE